MVLTEINRGPAILEALAECRRRAAAVAWCERNQDWRLKIHESGLRYWLLRLGNLMVGR